MGEVKSPSNDQVLHKKRFNSDAVHPGIPSWSAYRGGLHVELKMAYTSALHWDIHLYLRSASSGTEP